MTSYVFTIWLKYSFYMIKNDTKKYPLKCLITSNMQKKNKYKNTNFSTKSKIQYTFRKCKFLNPEH